MKQSHKVQKVFKNTNGFILLLEKVISGICLIVIFASPLAPVFAADESEATAPAAEVVPISEPTPPSEPQVETAVVESTTVTDTSAATTDVLENSIPPLDSSNEITTPVTNQETTSAELLATTPDTSGTTEVTEPVSNVSSSTNEVSSSENVVPAVEQGVQEADPVATTTPVIPSVDPTLLDAEVPVVPNEDVALPTTPSTTEETVAVAPEGETVELSAITTDENRFVFSKSECVSRGDETFYCTKGLVDAVPSHTDRVFAAVDSGGDKEIFIERSSKITQITSNAVDDDAPYFDELTNSLVWHRLIDGRYQIISYDVVEGVETQLTHDRFNNMEPHRYGNTTVWQGWIGNDWEIMMLQNDELTMLTDNTTHDITPSINGDHVVWQSFEGDSWKMKVYDIRTKEVQTIEDSAGGSVENPRFVLVYDTKLDTGDVETRGFNLETGEVVSLGAKPATIPEDIPDPDQTGEKRAIVSTGVQPKTKIDESDDVPDAGSSGEPPLDTVSEDGDIVIPPLVVSDTASTTNTIASSTEGAITIPSFLATSSDSVAHIDDVIVLPFVPSTQTSTDSQ